MFLFSHFSNALDRSEKNSVPTEKQRCILVNCKYSCSLFHFSKALDRRTVYQQTNSAYPWTPFSLERYSWGRIRSNLCLDRTKCTVCIIYDVIPDFLQTVIRLCWAFCAWVTHSPLHLRHFLPGFAEMFLNQQSHSDKIRHEIWLWMDNAAT